MLQGEDALPVIDYFSIALTHGLILLACWRLLLRDDLDEGESAPQSRQRPWLKDNAGDTQPDA